MFIKITTPTNPLRIENILRPYKHGEQPFTPELAKQILSSTNYPRSIRDMFQIIADLPTSEQTQYKDIILSTFDHREQPNDIKIIAKKLALANNYEDELNQIINHDPTTDNQNSIIYASAINEIDTYIYFDKKTNLSKYPPNLTVYFAKEYVDLSCIDLSPVKNIKFKEGSTVNLRRCQNLPEDLDVSICSKADLSYTDLSKIKSLKFKEGSIVDLSHCKNLPPDLDVSMCSQIYLCDIDLTQFSNLKFKKGSAVYLRNCTNLPENLDISMCDSVDLSFTNLSTVKNLKFKEGSAVNLHDCQNLPKDLDISICSKISLEHIDLSKINTLKFKKGSTVDLSFCKNLPEDLDISMCSEVDFAFTDLSTIKTLTLKNKTQQKKIHHIIPKNWQGKIIYAKKNIFTHFNTLFKNSQAR